MYSMARRRTSAENLRASRLVGRVFTRRSFHTTFKNTTDLPLDFIKEVYKFVVPPGVSGVELVVHNISEGCCGRAYPGGHRRVLVRIGPENTFPRKFMAYKGKGYLEHTYRNRNEAVVHIMAHELKHLWQEKHPLRGRVKGSRGQYSERDADAYAIRKVREWRVAHPDNTPLFDPVAVFEPPVNNEKFLVIATGCGEALGIEPETPLMAQRTLLSWPPHIRKNLKIVPEGECERVIGKYSDGSPRERWRLKDERGKA